MNQDLHDAAKERQVTTRGWTMVVANGKRKAVKNYQNAGPTKLWATEQLIDGLLARAQWDTAPASFTIREVLARVVSHETSEIDWNKSRTLKEITSTNHGVTEIGIERVACSDDCPVYTFICQSDGTFRYEGVAKVEKLGKLTGRISPQDFNRLAQFLSDSGYVELESAYRPRTGWASDYPNVWTMIVANGKRKVVSNYQNAAPTSLWATEQLIEGLLAKAEWDPAPKSDGTKK